MTQPLEGDSVTRHPWIEAAKTVAALGEVPPLSAQTFEVAPSVVTPAPVAAILAMVEEVLACPAAEWMDGWIALGTIVEKAAERRIKAGEE